MSVIAKAQSKRPLVDILAQEFADFSKYKLAKAFVRWSRDHTASDLTETERTNWINMINRINAVLK